MTGLDASIDVILEIATLVTDDELEVVAEGPDLIVHQPPESLASMGDVVRRMHTESGLLQSVERSTISLGDAGDQVLAFIREHVPEPGAVPLAGNSIATDRRFLATHLPQVDSHLHYRNVDVSTVKELCRRWYPDAYAAAPTKAGGHRAMADIRESLEELRHYRATIFRS